ncbi:DHH family phosphoesterase [Halalkalibacter oceani]|uniref:DHH family phosphoesterase n=1 Tax=Halalkalibacter oceani TaxID=1653776 RepID=UPI00339A15D5
MKVKLFTHTDLDGVSCGIVASYQFNDLDITYCNYDDIDNKVSEFIAEKAYLLYDLILITDISVNEHVAKEINQYIADKTVLLDHHATAEWLNEYKWATVDDMETQIISEDSYTNVKSSGTSMLFDYLCEKYDCYDFELSNYVEKVRRYDSWEWSTKYNDIHAKQLNDLFFILGRDLFFNRFSNNISVDFTKNEEQVLKMEQNKINKYIEMASENVMQTNVLGYNAGVVFAEQYTSQLGNELAKKNPQYDFIVIINPQQRKISYRGINEDIDLGKEVTAKFGGGGHSRAAGSEFDEELLNGFIDGLFKEK